MKMEQNIEKLISELNVIRDLVKEHDFEHMDSIHKYLCKQYIRRFNILYKQGRDISDYNYLDGVD